MKNRTLDFNASLTEHRRGALDVGLIDRERKVLQRPFAFVFLKHDHPGIAARAQKQPVAFFISNADLEIEHFEIKRLGLCQVFHSNRDFVDSSDW